MMAGGRSRQRPALWLAGVLLLLAAGSGYDDWRVSRWPTVTATVTAIETTGGGRLPGRLGVRVSPYPRLTVAWLRDGRQETATCIVTDRREADDFRAGDQLTVHLDPDDQHHATLVALSRRTVVLAGGGLLVLAAVLWRRRRPDSGTVQA